MLGGKLKRGTQVEGPHGEVVGTVVVDSKLLGEVVQEVKAVGGIETFLVLPVAAFHFAVVAWGIWTVDSANSGSQPWLPCASKDIL